MRATVEFENQVMSNSPRKFKMYLLSKEYSYWKLIGADA